MRSQVSERTNARDRIMETASTLFYAEGIHAVGVDRVVQDSGVAKATLYQHFRSKNELVAACLRQRSDHWCRHIAEPIRSKAGSPGDRRSVHGLRRFGPVYVNAGIPLAVRSSMPPPNFPSTTVRWQKRSKADRAQVRQLFAELLAPLPSQAGQKELVDQLVLLYDGTMISAQLDWKAKPHRSAKAAVARLLEDQTASLTILAVSKGQRPW